MKELRAARLYLFGAPIWDWLGLLPFLAFVLLFLVIPSANLFAGAFVNRTGVFTLENIVVFGNPFVLRSYLVSLQVSLVTALVGGVFGFLVAYAITLGRAPGWMRGVIMTFSGLAANFGGVPLAFAFIATLGRTGFLTALLKGICFPAGESEVCPFNPYDYGFNLYSVTGLVMTYTYFQFPLMVLIITPALEGLRTEWREACESLGGSQLHYWRDVAFPVMMPSLLGAMLLLFSNAFGAYATAQALTGGSIPLVTILIGQQIRGDVLNNPHEGYALALGMVVVMALTVWGYAVLQRRTTEWLRR
ncbi:MAG: ABC transporter permease subunit [Anaerolineae bacterium]|nr:ABC transporter permease subunit [Thermoflexales bacterium]MDW8396050.1 ABC transporter permease subunit [Anaerolineae bacterium]